VSFDLTEVRKIDAELLAKWITEIKLGNQTAAAQLVRHYEPEVRRFVRFRLTDPRLRRLFDSIDICQSVMARFFNHIQTDCISVEHPLQLLKLLTTMARNSLIDHARKARVRQRISGFDGDPEQILNLKDPVVAPSDQIERADLVSLIRKSLRPDEQNILDKWMLGHGWEALSVEFACEPDAIRKKLTRAIDRAANELGLLEDRSV
jgi:RNA polymerase sigma factor (sigma-70 family)